MARCRAGCRLLVNAKANASAHGGDPERIYLIGHSAGATHIATYLYHPNPGIHPARSVIYNPGYSGQR